MSCRRFLNSLMSLYLFRDAVPARHSVNGLGSKAGTPATYWVPFPRAVRWPIILAPLRNGAEWRHEEQSCTQSKPEKGNDTKEVFTRFFQTQVRSLGRGPGNEVGFYPFDCENNKVKLKFEPVTWSTWSAASLSILENNRPWPWWMTDQDWADSRWLIRQFTSAGSWFSLRRFKASVSVEAVEERKSTRSNTFIDLWIRFWIKIHSDVQAKLVAQTVMKTTPSLSKWQTFSL